MLDNEKTCENCNYEFESCEGEHCRHCIHNAEEHFEPKIIVPTEAEIRNKAIDEFAEMLKGNDAEKTFENIQLFEAKFNEAVEKAVTERLRGNVPKTTTSLNNTSITKEQFRSMSYMEKMNLYNENKELFNELNNK